MTDELSHFNEEQRAHMVDVTKKSETQRRAIATTTLHMEAATLTRIKDGLIDKGDVLAVAQVAGIMAAKKTSELIPMCHPIMTTKVNIMFTDNGKDQINVIAEVVTIGKTGVEMEALTAVTVTALTVYDMCKAIDKRIIIDNTHLVEKTGGKSGKFRFDK